MGKTEEDRETERRRDEALRRAMSTPPKPHKPIEKKRATKKRKSDGSGSKGA
jgi:hypothetical protein